MRPSALTPAAASSPLPNAATVPFGRACTHLTDVRALRPAAGMSLGHLGRQRGQENCVEAWNVQARRLDAGNRCLLESRHVNGQSLSVGSGHRNSREGPMIRFCGKMH